jgi:hypothetical protein
MIFFAKLFCNDIGRQATTTSIQIHKQKIDETPKPSTLKTAKNQTLKTEIVVFRVDP